MMKLIVLAALAVVSWLVAVVREGRSKRFMRGNAAEFRGRDAIPVKVVEVDALKSPSKLLRSAEAAVLVADADALRLVFVPGRGADPDSVVFDRTRTSVTMLGRSAAAPGVPVLIQLTDGDESVLVYASNTVGRPSAPATSELHQALTGRLQLIRGEGIADEPLPVRWAAPLGGVVAALTLVTVFTALSLPAPSGPQVVRFGPAGDVYVALDEDLLVLDGNGRLRSQHRWRDMNLEDGVTDFKVQPDGSLLAADFERGVVQYCAAPGAACRTWPLFEGDENHIGRAFKFTLVDAGQRVLIADTARHRVLEADLQKGVIRALDTAGLESLCFPNRIERLASGRVMLTDTNNHRVLVWNDWLDVGQVEPRSLMLADNVGGPSSCAAGPGGDLDNAFLARELDNRAARVDDETAAELRARLEAKAESLRNDPDMDPLAMLKALSDEVLPAPLAGMPAGAVWPTDVFEADGYTWVLANADNLYGGSFMVFDSSLEPVGAVALPDHADPWGGDGRDGRVLVADNSGNRVIEFTANGDYVGLFAEAVLQSVSDSQASAREAVNLRVAGLMVVLVIVALVLIVGSRLGMRRHIRAIEASLA